jgi:hypothetical protein
MHDLPYYTLVFARHSPVTGFGVFVVEKSVSVRSRYTTISTNISSPSFIIKSRNFSLRFPYATRLLAKKRWWKWCIGTCSHKKIKIMDETPSASAHHIKKMFLLAFMSRKILIFMLEGFKRGDGQFLESIRWRLKIDDFMALRDVASGKCLWINEAS